MRFIVERIEDEIASLEEIETGNIVNYNISEIPFKIFEGDVLILENETWIIDKKSKQKIQKRIKRKMKNLWDE